MSALHSYFNVVVSKSREQPSFSCAGLSCWRGLSRSHTAQSALVVTSWEKHCVFFFSERGKGGERAGNMLCIYVLSTVFSQATNSLFNFSPSKVILSTGHTDASVLGISSSEFAKLAISFPQMPLLGVTRNLKQGLPSCPGREGK